MANIAVNTSADAGIVARVAGFATELKARFERYSVYRKTLAELQTLSNRELADLGLSRSMLRRTAFEAAYL